MSVDLHHKDILHNFGSVQSQVILEKDLQQFFKVTPPVKIQNQFLELEGSASNQFLYLNLVLKVIEEMDIEPVQAFALLEAIRPVIYQKFEAVTDRFLGKTVLPGSKTAGIVFEAIDVFARLTDTYDSVIEEAKHFGDSQTFIMGGAIHRALSDKARLIQCYMQLYQVVPASVWRHVNWLYRTADEFNIFNQVMTDNLAFINHSLSVRQLYLYIMLLASAGTRNINCEEIAALGEMLKDWIKLVSIKKLDENSDKVVLCMDPEKLLIPVFSSQLEHRGSKSLFCFDLVKLSEKLQRTHIHHKFINNARYTLSPWTVEKINTNWTKYVERTQSRYQNADEMEVKTYIGLLETTSALHRPSQLGKAADHTINLSDRTFRDRKLDLTINSDEIPFVTITTLHAASIPSSNARVMDYSNTGYCLQWKDGIIPKLTVDEILIVEDEKNGVCRLGQIVWIKAVSRSDYQAGISIVSSDVIPVLACEIQSTYNKQTEKVSDGFLICHERGGRKHFGILLEQDSWRTGSVIELIQNEQSLKARLLEPLSQSDKYQSFNIAFFRD